MKCGVQVDRGEQQAQQRGCHARRDESRRICDKVNQNVTSGGGFRESRFKGLDRRRMVGFRLDEARPGDGRGRVYRLTRGRGAPQAGPSGHGRRRPQWRVLRQRAGGGPLHPRLGHRSRRRRPHFCRRAVRLRLPPRRLRGRRPQPLHQALQLHEQRHRQRQSDQRFDQYRRKRVRLHLIDRGVRPEPGRTDDRRGDSRARRFCTASPSTPSSASWPRAGRSSGSTT